MLKNFITVLQNPRIFSEYLKWGIKKLLNGKDIEKNIRNIMRVGDFSGFSEYLTVDNFLSEEEFSFFSNLEIDDGAIIDIGANIGVLSILFSKLHPNHKIFAIEPNPYSYQSLCKNIKRNDVSNITTHELALAEKIGTVPFLTDPVSRGTASITKSGTDGANLVHCTTLDDFVKTENIDKISLIKIDVEGYETLVFQGGKNVLEKLKPAVIYFEVCPPITEDAGFPPNQPAQILQEAGYQLYRLQVNGQLVKANVSDIDTLAYENWVAVLTR